MANWAQYYQTGYPVSSNTYIQQAPVQYPLLSEVRPEDYTRSYPAEVPVQPQPPQQQQAQQNPPFTITQYSGQQQQQQQQQYSQQQYANQQYADPYGYSYSRGYYDTGAQANQRGNLVNVPNQKHYNQSDPRQNRAGQGGQTQSTPRSSDQQTGFRQSRQDQQHHSSAQRGSGYGGQQQRSQPPQAPRRDQQSHPQQRSQPSPHAQQRSQPSPHAQQRSQLPSQQAYQQSKPPSAPRQGTNQPSQSKPQSQLGGAQQKLYKMAMNDDMEISDGEGERPRKKASWEICDVCDINFSSEKAYQMHCTGMLHTAKSQVRAESQAEAAQTQVSKPPEPKRAEEKTAPVQSSIDLTKDNGNDFTADVVEVDWTKGYFQKSGAQLTAAIPQQPNSITNKKDYYCKMCDKRFLGGPEMWDNHIIGKNHCKLMLKLQLEHGFKRFEEKYGKVECGLVITNGPVQTAAEVLTYTDVPTDEREKYKEFVFRCGVMTDYQCSICNVNLHSVDRWVTHIQSKKHFKKFVFYLTKIKETAEDFWQECGNLPGVYPGKIKDVIPTDGVQLRPWVYETFGIKNVAQAPAPPAEERPFEGTVTQLKNNFGVIDDYIFFDISLGKNLQLRDKVKGFYVQSPNTYFKLKAVKLEPNNGRPQNKVPPLMGQQAVPKSKPAVGYPTRPYPPRAGDAAPYARDARDARDTRDSRDARDTRNSRDARDSRAARDAPDTRDPRDPYARPYPDDPYRRPYPHDPYYDPYRRGYDAYYRAPHPDDRRPPHPDDRRPPHPDDRRPPHPDDRRPPHPDDRRPPHPDDRRPPPPDPKDPYRRPYPDDPYYRAPYPDDRRPPPPGRPDDRRPPPAGHPDDRRPPPPLLPDPKDPYRRPYPDDPYYRAPYPDDRRPPLDPHDPYRRPYPDDPYYRAPYPDDRRPPPPGHPDDRRPPPPGHPDDPYRRPYPDDPYYRAPYPDDRRPPPPGYPDDPYRRGPYPDDPYRRGPPDDLARELDDRAAAVDARSQVEIPGIDVSMAETRAYKGMDFESMGAPIPKGVPPPEPMPGQSMQQPGAMFSVDELKKLQETLKRMEAAKDDPFKQLALAAELRLLQDKQKEAKQLAKTIPLTQSQALKKLGDVMSEEQMEQLKKEMVKIEKKGKGKDDRRSRDGRRQDRSDRSERSDRPTSSTRTRHGKSNAQKQIEDSIMSEFQASPDGGEKRGNSSDKMPPWRAGEKDPWSSAERKQPPRDIFDEPEPEEKAPWETDDGKNAPWETDNNKTPWDTGAKDDPWDSNDKNADPWEGDKKSAWDTDNKAVDVPWDNDNKDTSWDDDKPKGTPWDTQEADDVPWDSGAKDSSWNDVKEEKSTPWESDTKDTSWEPASKTDVSLVTSDSRIQAARKQSSETPTAADPWTSQDDAPWEVDNKDTPWESPQKSVNSRRMGSIARDAQKEGVALITPDSEAKIRAARKLGGNGEKSGEVTLVTPDIEAKIRQAREQAKRSGSAQPERSTGTPSGRDDPWGGGSKPTPSPWADKPNVTTDIADIEAKIKEVRRQREMEEKSRENTAADNNSWRAGSEKKETSWRSAEELKATSWRGDSATKDVSAPWEDSGRKVEVVAPWGGAERNEKPTNPWDTERSEKPKNPWDADRKAKDNGTPWEEDRRKVVVAPWEEEKKSVKDTIAAPWEEDRKTDKAKVVAPWEEQRKVVVAPWEKDIGSRNKSPPRSVPPVAPWEKDMPKKPGVTPLPPPALGAAPPWASKTKEPEVSEALRITRSDVQAAKRAPWNKGKDSDSDSLRSRDRDSRGRGEDWSRSPAAAVVAPWEKDRASGTGDVDILGDGVDRDYRRDVDLRRSADAPWNQTRKVDRHESPRGRASKEEAVDAVQKFLVAYEDFHRKGGSHLTFEQLSPQVRDLVSHIRDVTYNNMEDVISTVHMLLALDPRVTEMLTDYSPADLRTLVEAHGRIQIQAMEILSVSVRHLVDLHRSSARAGDGSIDRETHGEKRRASPPWGRGKHSEEKRPRY